MESGRRFTLRWYAARAVPCPDGGWIGTDGNAERKVSTTSVGHAYVMAETAAPPTDARSRAKQPRRIGPGIVVGSICAAVAIGVAQLTAGIVNPEASPIVAVGGTAIDATPEWLKGFAIRTFGANDKRVLLAGIGVTLAVVAVVIGVAAVRRPMAGYAGLAVFGLVGVAAALTRPDGAPIDALPSITGGLAGALMLWMFLPAVAPSFATPAPVRTTPTGIDRRRFFLTGAAGAAAAVVAGGAGRVFAQRFEADASRAAVHLPSSAVTSPARAGTDLTVPGLSPFITSNAEFYRVDTALLVPAVKAEDWRLRIHGMVDHEMTLTFDQLMNRPLIERDITLNCVSNEVGGGYIGNARWLGTRLESILDEVGVDPTADQLVSRSVDGFTVGTPTAVAMDGRDAMLAIAMNGEPLPLDHGFPVRMLVPGLYGYVSATKWVVDIELSTFDAFDAYWIRRGWAQQAPVKTASRIDTPRANARLDAGTVPVAGVAWAQHRGIASVDLRADDGPWMPARLSAEDTVDTWRQWLVMWDATPGDHLLEVRATDQTGAVQTEASAPPFPDGATGYHAIVVQVT
jgi:DMSO/TMAO reductase YedYZ molybdopterin-dependent catalytic subunit